ncbi:hypothetical protein C8R43DRAFT_1042524 [Mycena crocata]|nr:hypothetical protein C8R43DRAFT_1042524 [Mycena crocata]
MVTVPKIVAHQARPLESARTDTHAVAKYRSKLDDNREKAIKNPLASGQEHSLTPTLPTPSSDLRPRRALPIHGVDPCAPVTVCLRLVEALQTGVDKFSQVWTARVIPTFGSTAPEAMVVLKIVQPSMCKYPTGDESWIYDYNEVLEDLAEHEAWSYHNLAEQQGSCVPYFFGKHEITTPNGELAWVLVFEHIPGPTLSEVAKVKNLGDAQLKEICEMAVSSAEEFASSGLVLADVRGPNIILTGPPGTQRAVLIDHYGVVPGKTAIRDSVESILEAVCESLGPAYDDELFAAVASVKKAFLERTTTQD